MNSTILEQDNTITALQAWVQATLRLPEIVWEPLAGDASFRRYFRLKTPHGLIAAYAPPHSENNEGFIKIAAALKQINVHAPEVKAFDLEKGFFIITDLGKQLYSQALTLQTANTLYSQALDTLAHMQTIATVPEYQMQHFDDKFMTQEMLSFKTWFLQKYLKFDLDKMQERQWDEMICRLIAFATRQPQVFMHRDYHSRNLMVCEQQTPGVLDFQDATWGPITYDAVSLLRDAYVDWPRANVLQWAETFFDRISDNKNMRNVSRAEFIDAFNWMGIQRHLKAIFIFARKFLRDGTSAYLNDIPRCLNYIVTVSQDYPELKVLHGFCTQHILPAWEENKS